MFIFFNDTATTEIYTLSLHDALPILFVYILGEFLKPRLQARFLQLGKHSRGAGRQPPKSKSQSAERIRDRKSTRLNSSNVRISYAVFCLKKKRHPRRGCTLS